MRKASCARRRNGLDGVATGTALRNLFINMFGGKGDISTSGGGNIETEGYESPREDPYANSKMQLEVGDVVSVTLQSESRSALEFSLCGGGGCCQLSVHGLTPEGIMTYMGYDDCKPECLFPNKMDLGLSANPLTMQLVSEGEYQFEVERRPGELAVWKPGHRDHTITASLPAAAAAYPTLELIVRPVIPNRAFPFVTFTWINPPEETVNGNGTTVMDSGDTTEPISTSDDIAEQA